jgi:hypothetical protein
MPPVIPNNGTAPHSGSSLYGLVHPRIIAGIVRFKNRDAGLADVFGTFAHAPQEAALCGVGRLSRIFVVMPAAIAVG